MICEALTLSRFYRETYQPMKHLGGSPATIEDFIYKLSTWERISGIPLDQIEPKHVAKHMEILIERGRRPATVNGARRVILAVLAYAREQDGDLTHPVWEKRSARVEAVRESHDEPEAYLKQELETLVEVAQNSRLLDTYCGIPCFKWWPGLILTKFSTGVRIGALMQARFCDLDFNARTLTIKGSTQKNRKGRRYKLIPDAMRALWGMGEKPREMLFPWPFDKQGRQWPTLTRHFRLLIDKAGLKQDPHPFHKIRRSTASYTAAGGGKIMAQEQLGHSSAAITEVYFDPRIVQTPQAADVLPALAIKFKGKAP